jgi:hypothetical protein
MAAVRHITPAELMEKFDKEVESNMKEVCIIYLLIFILVNNKQIL